MNLRPKTFDYQRPKILDEVIEILREHRDAAKILAGGQSLVPLMKLRLAEPAYLIDITELADLRYIEEDGDHVEIGALATHHDLETSSLIQHRAPSLRDAALVLGDPLVRNRGTFGGAVCHADPAADYPSVLVSLGAEFFARGRDGERVIPAKDFFLDYFLSAVHPDELLTRARIPSLKTGEGSAFLKMERVVGDFAIVGAAAFVSLNKNGVAEKVNLTLSAVGSIPVVPTKMIAKLEGKKLEETLVADAAEELREAIDPPSDIRASSEYRADMAVVYAKRAVLDAARRARGESPVFVAEAQPLRAY